TTNGTLFGYYSYNQLFKASGSVTLRVEGVPMEDQNHYERLLDFKVSPVVKEC
ncbi:unnamed protein product, partial [Rotaria magnacalcarata]